MSINHFSTDLPAEALWWAQQQQQTIIMEPNPNSPWQASSHHYRQHNNYHPQHHQSWLNSHSPLEPAPPMFRPQNPPHSFNLNHEDDEEQDQEVYLHEQQQQQQQQEHQQQEAQLEKELMFEKPLTPSDVGKLNRLVIPKQHAEKYFPLGADSVDKGLQLSFEDESGKCWRFRYSYWNSSQSYVLTKGWSRYVKEKQLDAGDVVFFQRCRTDGDRLFIGWRRRGGSGGGGGGGGDGGGGGVGGGGMVVQGRSGGVWSRGMYSPSGHQPYLTSSSSSSVQHGHGHGATPANATTGVPYQPDCLHAGQVVQNQIGMPAMVNSRRLRLFGVNLECQLLEHESEPSTPDGSSSMSSQGPTPTTYNHHHHQFYYSSSSANNCSSNSDPHVANSP